MNIGTNTGMNTVNYSYPLYHDQTAAQKKPAQSTLGIDSPSSRINKSGFNTEDSTDSVNKTGKVSPAECQTCKSRKYKDDSDESNVSFKTPGHISPAASRGTVLAHEQEHVSNAIAEGNKADSELVSATVSLQMARCPECGTMYVCGGETRTVMKHYSDNQYDKGRKTIEGSFLRGQNVDQYA